MTTIQGGQAGAREIHLREYWRVVVERRWAVAAVFLFVLGLVTAYSFLAAPVYQASALVEVQPQARRLSPGQDVSGMGVAGYGWFAEEKYQNTQVDIAKSRSVAERAFRNLGLAADPRFAASKDPVGAFRSLIQVNPRRDTGLLEISMRGKNREEVARWVNAVVDVYVSRNLEKAKENAQQAIDSIESLMTPLKERLNDVESRRFDVLKETQILSPEGQAEIVKQRLSKLNADITDKKSEVDRLDGILAKIHEIQMNDGDPRSIPELAKDDALQKLVAERVGLEKEFESIKVTYRAGAPQYQEKASQLDTIRKRMWDQVNVDLGRIQNQYDLAVRDERSLEGDLREAEQRAYQVGVATSKYDVVRTDASTAKQMYDAIAKTLSEVRVSSQLLSNNIIVVDHAIPPIAPASPNKRLNLALGTIIGLFLGLGFAFFLDYLDNTFHEPEDVEQYLGLNAVAVVPRFSPAEAESSLVREAYQTLRTALVFLSNGRERKVVLVTSTAPQEGKSETVAHLARALAASGERVLLVDCDLRRPTQHLRMGLNRDGGLTDFLSANQPFLNWRTYVKPAGVDNLEVLTCGPIPPNPPDLLGGERFSRFLAEARSSYDWVLIDSPPAATLTDASILGTIADMVLLVVRHNHTDRDGVVRIVQQMRRVGANLAGVVLNNVSLSGTFAKNYYYASYYHKDDASRGENKPRRASDDVGAGAGR